MWWIFWELFLTFVFIGNIRSRYGKGLMLIVFLFRICLLNTHQVELRLWL